MGKIFVYTKRRAWAASFRAEWSECKWIEENGKQNLNAVDEFIAHYSFYIKYNMRVWIGR